MERERKERKEERRATRKNRPAMGKEPAPAPASVGRGRQERPHSPPHPHGSSCAPQTGASSFLPWGEARPVGPFLIAINNRLITKIPGLFTPLNK